jgi:hypothetical protein
MTAPGITVDLGSGPSVTIAGGSAIALQPRQAEILQAMLDRFAEILQAMLDRFDQPIPVAALVAAVWGRGQGTDANLATNICTLRDALRATPLEIVSIMDAHRGRGGRGYGELAAYQLSWRGAGRPDCRVMAPRGRTPGDIRARLGRDEGRDL